MKDVRGELWIVNGLRELSRLEFAHGVHSCDVFRFHDLTSLSERHSERCITGSDGRSVARVGSRLSFDRPTDDRVVNPEGRLSGHERGRDDQREDLTRPIADL